MVIREFVRIAPDVRLGRDVKIYAFANLYGCEIGDESKIGTFVEIQKGAKIGRKVKISSHTFICEGVEIEDNVFIGHGVMFINDKYPHATTEGGRVTDRSRLGMYSNIHQARCFDRQQCNHSLWRNHW